MGSSAPRRLKVCLEVLLLESKLLPRVTIFVDFARWEHVVGKLVIDLPVEF